MIIKKTLKIKEFDNVLTNNLGTVLSKYVRAVNQSPTSFIDVGTFVGFAKSLSSKRRRVPCVPKGEVFGIVQECTFDGLDGNDLSFTIEILERYQHLDFDKIELKAKFYCRVEESENKQSYYYQVLHLVSVYVDIPRILMPS